MPLPDWMKGRIGQLAEPQESRVRTSSRGRKGQGNVWNGKTLPDRGIAHTSINYRLYDRRTGTLLSFNSTNSLDSLVTDVLRTRDENPTAQIMAVEYDGPAWPGI